MVERYRRGKRKKPLLLGSHQKCWIWGRNTVLETLRAGRWPVLELHVADHFDRDRLTEIRDWATRRQVALQIEPADRLTQLCHSSEHQGYLAKMPPYPYSSAEDMLAGRPANPLYGILDSIQDPYNLGAIARSAAVLGFDGLFISTAGQVGVTSLVARTSAGAVNHLDIARLDDLPAFTEKLRTQGVTIVGTEQQAPTRLFECDFRTPTAIVVGNEGAGISASLLRICDRRVSIPQCGAVDSLNAAVSAGILFYEARRQRSASPDQPGRNTNDAPPVAESS
jgi:23S rRNA (guanosine2251-2'-O)-methyltransferase